MGKTCSFTQRKTPFEFFGPPQERGRVQRMALRGVKPESIAERAKFFLFGPPGCGKTTGILEQFHSCYIIDTERGAVKYRGLFEKSKSVHFPSADIHEVTDEVRSLLTEKHSYRTLVIDPVTNLWHQALEIGERKVGTAHAAHFGHANKIIRTLNNLLVRLDMNIVVTAHQKDEYDGNNNKIGFTFDAWNKSGYLFDYVLRLERQKEQEKDKTIVKRMCHVVKQRVEPGKPPLPETFEWNYQAFKEHFGAILEKESVPEVKASSEKIERTRGLVKTLNIPDDTLERWFEKGHVESFEEMTDTQISSVIEYCNKVMEKLSK